MLGFEQREIFRDAWQVRIGISRATVAGGGGWQIAEQLLHRTQAGVRFGKIREGTRRSQVGSLRLRPAPLAPPLVAHVIVNDPQHLSARERASVLSREAARNRKAALVPVVRHRLTRAQQLYIPRAVRLAHSSVE